MRRYRFSARFYWFYAGFTFQVSVKRYGFYCYHNHFDFPHWCLRMYFARERHALAVAKFLGVSL